MALDRVAFLSVCEDMADREALFISGTSIALFLSLLDLAEYRGFWDEMTDSDWDEIEALVGKATGEIL